MDDNEEEVINVLNKDIDTLGKQMIASKIEQQQVVMQSAMDGGPSSMHEALLHMIEKRGLGIRFLAARVSVRRKRLLGMLHGREEMPPEVFDKLYDVIYPS